MHTYIPMCPKLKYRKQASPGHATLWYLSASPFKMAATLFSLAQMMKVKPNLDLNRGGSL
jgi:hypothetical protein